MQEQVIVLFSGGQDSTTCLAWAIDKWGVDNVHPLGFYYNQSHEIELEQARTIAKKLGVHSRLQFMSAVQLRTLGAAALTSREIEPSVNATGTGNKYAEDHDLPSTFVPGRNMLFLTLATAYGAKLGVYNLVTGVCAADEAGYPDCRPEFISAAVDALSLALNEEIWIHTPLIERTKAETFQLASSLDVLNIVLEDSHTCYKGDRSRKHAWGYGCGVCGACLEREKGWGEFVKLRSEHVD